MKKQLNEYHSQPLYVKREDIPKKIGLLSAVLYSIILIPLALFALIVLLGAL